MFILLFVLSLFATVIGFKLLVKSKVTKNDTLGAAGIITMILAGVIAVLVLVAIFIATDEVLSSRYIDEKITMYKEENANIEEQIDILVQNYMRYEVETFSVIKSENPIAFVSLYPELKSDELVQNQISVYIENNKKIRELKEQEIDTSKSKWWLYFGK